MSSRQKSTPLLTLSRAEAGLPAARVLELVRSGALVSREELVARGDLSPASVRRVTTSLLEAGFLRERPDLVREGGLGRPRVPVEIDSDGYVVIGLHLGRQRTTVALGDLAGRVIAHAEAPGIGSGSPDLATLSRVAAHLLGRVGGREALAVGLVAPWRDLGLSPDAAASQMGELSGLPVRTGDPVGAIAAADHLHRRAVGPAGLDDSSGFTLYFFAGDSLGWAMVADRGSRTEYFRGSSLTHFPTAADVLCGCGRRGCLEAVAGEDRFAERLFARGLIASPSPEAVYARAGDPEVLAALRERAHLLGTVGAGIRDMLGPDRVVLAGSGLTRSGEVMADVLEEFAVAPYGVVPVELARFGAGEAIAACTVGLGPVVEDPLGLVCASSEHAL